MFFYYNYFFFSLGFFKFENLKILKFCISFLFSLILFYFLFFFLIINMYFIILNYNFSNKYLFSIYFEPNINIFFYFIFKIFIYFFFILFIYFYYFLFFRKYQYFFLFTKINLYKINIFFVFNKST